jgi:hypothetical protein
VVLTRQHTASATEEYNGSTWTANPTGLNTARYRLGSCGTQTAALAFGGITPSITAATELYDGSTWTSNPNSMGTARAQLAGAGTQGAGLGFGGYTTTTVATEEWTGAGSRGYKNNYNKLIGGKNGT